MLQFVATHSNQKEFEIMSGSPRIFEIDRILPRDFSLAYLSQRLITAAHQNPRNFGMTQVNERVFRVIEIWTPCVINVISASFGSLNYRPSSLMSFTVDFLNTGGEGSNTLTWEILDSSDNILNSGTVNTGNIKWRSSGSVTVTGITAPATYKELRVRLKGPVQAAWIYSSVSYVLPVNLSVTAVLPGSDVFWPGTPVECRVRVSNAGYSGSQTIEWQVINNLDLSVLSSGSQSSGNIDDFAIAYVTINGIYSPTGDAIIFRIRARIQGSSEWTTSLIAIGNYLWITPPPNPIPRR
jgi:hypothetical protein